MKKKMKMIVVVLVVLICVLTVTENVFCAQLIIREQELVYFCEFCT
jgi:hypothetical protein